MTTYTVTTGRQEGLFAVPAQSINWGDLGSSPYGSWANWPSFKVDAGTSVVLQLDDDLGSVDFRIPRLNISRIGTLASVSVKISDTGSFSGEETTINFVADNEVTYTSGRYYRWTVTVNSNSEPDSPLISIDDTYSVYTKDLYTETLEDVDVLASFTTTLSTNLGLIRNIQATALGGDPYVVTDYVTLLDTTRTAKTVTNASIGTEIIIDTSNKKFGASSFGFSASSDLYAAMGSDFPSGTQDFTWEAWVRVESTTTTGAHVLQADATGGGFDIPMTISGTGVRFDYDISIDGSAYGLSALTSEFAFNTFHHVAFVRNGSALALYVNGTQTSTETITGAGVIDAPTTNTVYIGGKNTTFRGNIDEVRLSNSARYTSSFTPQNYVFFNDINTVLLLHAENFNDDGGTAFSSNQYIVEQSGGSPVITQKNPPQVEVVDYNGDAWDGTIDVVLRGFPKIVWDGENVYPVNIEGVRL